MNITQLKTLFKRARVQKLYAKSLAENDNSKNQVYFGPNFQALNIFPNDGVFTDNNAKKSMFKARIRFHWLTQNGNVAQAPAAQFILYPQYPEIRFSGFLKGCAEAPSKIMASRSPGRILFLGVTDDKRVIGFVVEESSEIATEFRAQKLTPTTGVFISLDMPNVPTDSDSRMRLISELGRIHRLGWINSKQLDSGGHIKPCNAPQCGGFTLEAELGISKNSEAEPDFCGWEIKQHNVANFDRLETGTITLMTPEPTGGFYNEHGPEAFVRKFGYMDKKGRPDRLNFGGIHKVGMQHATTHLTMILSGYDSVRNRITNTDGDVVLADKSGNIAAKWSFSGLLAHWSRKHMQTAYIPSQCNKEFSRKYCYGHKIRLAQRTDGLRLLSAFASGSAYYDPGIKLEHASGHPLVKRRNQFRIASKNIASLYATIEVVEV